MRRIAQRKKKVTVKVTTKTVKFHKEKKLCETLRLTPITLWLTRQVYVTSSKTSEGVFL